MLLDLSKRNLGVDVPLDVMQRDAPCEHCGVPAGGDCRAVGFSMLRCPRQLAMDKLLGYPEIES